MILGVDVMKVIKNNDTKSNLKARGAFIKSILAASVSLAILSSAPVLAKNNVLMEEVMVKAQKKSAAEAVQMCLLRFPPIPATKLRRCLPLT